ncbi:MAG: hypothetical protein ISS23_01820 [Nanoarchaeota archaeon]|nr:hypothetical protein [Nanoarchaeota archaeon]
MESKKLESIIIRIPGKYKPDPLEQAKETLRLAIEVSDEIKKATAKCQSITEIEGQPVSVIGLKMTGKDSVETIEITYLSKRISNRSYTKDEFYHL